MSNLKNPGELAADSKIKKTTLGFFSLQEWFNSKIIVLSHNLLVSHAQGT